MTSRYRYKCILPVILLGLLGLHSVSFGAGLNTDVALTPPEDGTIIRFQWRESHFQMTRLPWTKTSR